MTCKQCLYFYPDYDDKGRPISTPHCQYSYNDGYAPCEVNDDYDTPDID